MITLDNKLTLAQFSEALGYKRKKAVLAELEEKKNSYLVLFKKNQEAYLQKILDIIATDNYFKTLEAILMPSATLTYGIRVTKKENLSFAPFTYDYTLEDFLSDSQWMNSTVDCQVMVLANGKPIYIVGDPIAGESNTELKSLEAEIDALKKSLNVNHAKEIELEAINYLISNGKVCFEGYELPDIIKLIE